MPPMPPMGPGGRKPGGPHGARLTMEKPKDAKNTLKKLIGYIGRNRYLFFALIGVMLINNSAQPCRTVNTADSHRLHYSHQKENKR